VWAVGSPKTRDASLVALCVDSDGREMRFVAFTATDEAVAASEPTLAVAWSGSPDRVVWSDWGDDPLSTAASPTISRMMSSSRRSAVVVVCTCGDATRSAVSSVSAAAVAASQS
jgi:hypothetical protein